VGGRGYVRVRGEAIDDWNHGGGRYDRVRDWSTRPRLQDGGRAGLRQLLFSAPSLLAHAAAATLLCFAGFI
jgi:hypothetical protein